VSCQRHNKSVFVLPAQAGRWQPATVLHARERRSLFASPGADIKLAPGLETRIGLLAGIFLHLQQINPIQTPRGTLFGKTRQFLHHGLPKVFFYWKAGPYHRANKRPWQSQTYKEKARSDGFGVTGPAGRSPLSEWHGRALARTNWAVQGAGRSWAMDWDGSKAASDVQ